MTKQSYFWATPSGPINLMKAEDMPVKRIVGGKTYEGITDPGTYNSLKNEYEAAIQRAKESSVPIQDQERAKKMIELLLYEKRKELTFQDISSLDVMANVIYGPFTVEYRIEDACAHDSCPVDGMCEHCKEPVKVAILYDDTPEKERPDYINNEFKKVSKSDLKSALREVNLKNKEIRDSYEDPTRLDFRIKDSRGFPTGDVIDGAKVKVDDDPIIAVMRIARMDK